MKGLFKIIKYKKRILGILTVFAIAILGITGHLRGAEGAIDRGNQTREGKILTKSESEKVKAIWRVIGDQEIATWGGKEWLAKTEKQKKEAIEKVCEAWKKEGYQRIKSIEYFVEDVDSYYFHHGKKNPEEGLKEKVGLVVSLSAFFAEM